MADMVQVEVYGRQSGFDYDSIAILDYFNTLKVDKKYYGFDAFSMTLPLTKENASMFVTDSILMIQDEFFYIDNVSVEKIESGMFTVAGKSLLAKATNRIVAQTYTATNKAPELIAADLLNRHVISPSDSTRKFNYLSLVPISSPFTGEVVDNYQNSYGIVMSELENLAETYDFGMRETGIDIQNVSQRIELFKGRDLSDTIEFCSAFENLLDEGYDSSNFNEANVAYVFGEGEGNARKSVIVNQGGSGIDKREAYIDARDQQQTTDDVTLTDAQYLNALRQRGRTALTERKPALTILGNINLKSELFKYQVDYDLGDRVRITSDMFGLSKTAVLTEMSEVWTEDSHTLTPTFDKESPIIYKLL